MPVQLLEPVPDIQLPNRRSSKRDYAQIAKALAQLKDDEWLPVACPTWEEANRTRARIQNWFWWNNIVLSTVVRGTCVYLKPRTESS